MSITRSPNAEVCINAEFRLDRGRLIPPAKSALNSAFAAFSPIFWTPSHFAPYRVSDLHRAFIHSQSHSGELLFFSNSLLIAILLLILTLRAARIPGTPAANILFSLCALGWSAGGLLRTLLLQSGTIEFNASYVEVLNSWGLILDGVNPVARTNIAPEINAPEIPSLYGFSYTVLSQRKQKSFVVAGAGELPEGSLDPADLIRSGGTSSDAMAEKARFVMGLMSARLKGLGVD